MSDNTADNPLRLTDFSNGKVPPDARLYKMRDGRPLLLSKKVIVSAFRPAGMTAPGSTASERSAYVTISSLPVVTSGN